MISIPEAIKELFRQDNTRVEQTRRKWKLRFYDSEIELLYPEDTLFPSDTLFPVSQDPFYVIDNSQMVTESIVLTESISVYEDLKFGGCNSAQFEITVADVLMDLTGKEFSVSVEIGEYELMMGIYVVDSFVRQADRRLKKITAYDRMQKLHIDVAMWYQGLNFPMSLKEFRNSLCNHVGITQIDTTLPQDNMVVTKGIDPKQLFGLDVLRAICELNGCFGIIDKTGRFKYQFLTESSLFPSEELFPDEELFPRGMSESESELLPHYKQSETTYRDYMTKPIECLKLRQEEGDIGVTYGKGSNCYIIEGNFLVFGKSTDEMMQIAAITYEKISGRTYRPSKIVAPALPWLEVGDGIVCHTGDDVIETYCLKRVMRGIQCMMDTYESSGNIQQKNRFGINTQFIQLDGKTATVKKSVEEVSVKVTDLKEFTEAQLKIQADQILAEVKRAKEEEAALKILADSITLDVKNFKTDTASKFEQTAEQISLKVSKGNVSSEISVESDKVTLTGNRLIIDSNNLKLDGYGNADFCGQITGGSIDIGNGTFTVDRDGNVGIDSGEINIGPVKIRENYADLGAFRVSNVQDGILYSNDNSIQIMTDAWIDVSTPTILLSKDGKSTRISNSTIRTQDIILGALEEEYGREWGYISYNIIELWDRIARLENQ